MADELALVLAGAQTVVIVATAVFAWLSLRKFRDSRGIDFVINAESAIDPLHHGFVGSSPELIKNVYEPRYMLSSLTDDEVAAFPFMNSLYRHVSRLCFMLTDDRIDLGLSPAARREMLDVWLTSLKLHRDHPAMKAIHTSAMANQSFNSAFLTLADGVMLTTKSQPSDDPPDLADDLPT